MANFKSQGVKKRILSIYFALTLCVPLVLLAQGNKGKGKKEKRPNCQTVTADAAFRDNITDGIDGIRSDGYGKYLGLEDAQVYLLKESDHDFVLDTRNKNIEKEKGIDRKVTLDFSANNLILPLFYPVQVADVLIRVDEVLSDDPDGYTGQPKRFIMWFKIDRVGYRLVFDGLDESEWVSVTQTGTSPNRQWTIQSTDSHKARLERLKGAKRFTVGHFTMPFEITVDETAKPATCI